MSKEYDLQTDVLATIISHHVGHEKTRRTADGIRDAHRLAWRALHHHARHIRPLAVACDRWRRPRDRFRRLHVKLTRTGSIATGSSRSRPSCITSCTTGAATKKPSCRSASGKSRSSSMLWALLVKGKPLSSLNTQDCAEYVDRFLRDPRASPFACLLSDRSRPHRARF